MRGIGHPGNSIKIGLDLVVYLLKNIVSQIKIQNLDSCLRIVADVPAQAFHTIDAAPDPFIDLH